MWRFVVIVFFAVINSGQLDECSESVRPLILTPYIENNLITEGREAAAVLPLTGDVKSYAGYFTVDKRYDSNLFFWYFPAERKPDCAPVVLWLQGGPGVSSMFGLFSEIGPYKIINGDYVRKREIYWSKTMHLIFIDNPVGTGFSFTNSSQGYLKNKTTIGSQLYKALNQFFTLFPQLRNKDFYAAGESYAGKYVSSLSHTIHLNNLYKTKSKINLKGMIIGNGLVDPINQLDFGKYLYQIGLIGKQEKNEFDRIKNKIIQAIQNKDWMKADQFYSKMMNTDPHIKNSSSMSLYQRYTGFTNVYNYLVPEIDLFKQLNKFLNKKIVREHLPIVDKIFSAVSQPTAEKLKEDRLQSVVSWFSILLDNYKVLLYSGQLDITVAYPLTENYLGKLNWCGARDFEIAERKQWRVEGRLAGYIKTASPSECDGSLKLVLVRNASHMAPNDQPEWVYSLVTDFTNE